MIQAYALQLACMALRICGRSSCIFMGSVPLQIPAVSGSANEPEGIRDRRRLEARVRGLLHRLALVLYLK